MSIIINQKLDICNAINYALGKLNNHCTKFHVDTEFGTIAIETTSQYEVLKPVTVLDWESAPDTDWVLHESRHHVTDDYYVSFGYKRFQDEALTKFQLVIAFCNCLMRHLTDSDIRTDVSNGLVRNYYWMVGDRCPDSWEITYAVMKRDTRKKISLGMMKKDYDNYEKHLRLIIEKRMSEAVDMAKTGNDRNNETFHGYGFGSDFYDTAVGLALMEFDRSHPIILQKITYKNYKKILGRDKCDHSALYIIDELFNYKEEEVKEGE